MARRGRKSLASLETQFPLDAENIAATSRLTPPKHLDEEEKRVFIRLVNGRPVNFFGSSDVDLLCDYVQAVVQSRLITQAIKVLSPKNSEYSLKVTRLLTVQQRHRNLLLTMARQLRLTVTSITRKSTALRMVGMGANDSSVKPDGKGNPWEFGGEEEVA